MKISKSTLEVLDNFSGINPSITLRPGNVIRVGTPALDLFAQAVVEDEFPSKVKIFNLKKFLSVMSLFKDEADVEFSDKKIYIKSSRNTVEYTLAEADDGRKAMESPDKEPNVPTPAFTFTLSHDDLVQAQKAMSVLELPNMTFEDVGDSVRLSGTDDRNSAKDKYSIIVGTPTWVGEKKPTKISVSRSSVKFLPRSYTVGVHEAYVKFTSDDRVSYWVPALAAK